MLRRSAAALWLAVLLVGWIAPTARGQNKNAGEIRGTVTDASEASMPGVEVTIINVNTGVKVQLTTNAAGLYVAPSVIAGNYTIVFAKDGFRRLVRSGIALGVETITVNARLEVGALAQEVAVSAAASLVQTESAERSSTLVESLIKEMPLVGNNTYNLTALLPGVNNGSGNNASGASVGFNGTAGYQGNFMLDGGSNVRPISQNLGAVPPVETIGEIDFRTSNFGAEYGNGLAVVSVLSKSGTNQFHGSLFEFAQNNIMNARNYFALTVTPFRWNQFGGTVGGPIRRDKTFFFLSYQRLLQVNYAASYYTYPTAAMKGGDMSAFAQIYDPDTLAQTNGVWARQPLAGNLIPQSRMDPVSKAIQGYYAAPNLAGTFRNYYAALRTPLTQDWYNVKIDHHVTNSNRLTGSLMYSPLNMVYPGATCPLATGAGTRDCASYPQKSFDSQLTDAWTISPSVYNEFRISANRNGQEITPPSLNQGFGQKIGLKNLRADTFPNIGIGGSNGFTGLGTGLSSPLYQTAYMLSDMATWIHGRHIVKVGGEYDYYQANQAWGRVSPADMGFNGLFTRNPAVSSTAGLGYADFLFGLPQSWSATIIPLTGARGGNLQAFVQDDYKLRPNLTISAGLRWTIPFGWHEQHGRLANFAPELTNPATNTAGALAFGGSLQDTRYVGFAPRLGVAWTPRAGWSVRGGYGVFNIMNGQNTFGPNIGLGWTESGYKATTDSMTPIFRLQDGLPDPVVPSTTTRTPAMLNGQNLTYLPRTTALTFIQQYQVGVQHELPGRVLLDVAYVGTRGTNLGFGRDMNQVPMSALGPGNAQTRRPYPQFATITKLNFDGWSNYNSLQVLAKKQLSRGLTLQTSYTFSKALDTGAGSGWGGTTSVGVWQNANAPAQNYALSSLDVTHLFNGGLVWALPVGKNKAWLNHGGIVDAVVGGWQLSSLWQLHTGNPFTPVVGTSNLSGALSGNWLPMRLASGKAANPTIDRWFDTAAFAAPAPYTFGNSGRNILRGPKFADLDMTLSKNFALRMLGEGRTLQLRLDSYDVLNHTNFAQPNASIGTVAAGRITSALTSRTVQAGAKLMF